MSLPTRERELKPASKRIAGAIAQSLPTRERELKRVHGCVRLTRAWSLPTRERELKPSRLRFSRYAQ